jgi:hypothetical protein
MMAEKSSDTRKQPDKHVPIATDTHTIEGLLEAMFSVRSIPKLYNKAVV